MTGPRDPRISVYPSLHEEGMWSWTLVGMSFAYMGDRPTEADAWRAAEAVLLNCDPPQPARSPGWTVAPRILMPPRRPSP